jgi:hypothetical protein
MTITKSGVLLPQQDVADLYGPQELCSLLQLIHNTILLTAGLHTEYKGDGKSGVSFLLAQSFPSGKLVGVVGSGLEGVHCSSKFYYP